MNILIKFISTTACTLIAGLFVYLCAPETHTKRQATQHCCLPSSLGEVDKCIEIAYYEEKKYFALGRHGSQVRTKISFTGTTNPKH
jgi:hypothetical protein